MKHYYYQEEIYFANQRDENFLRMNQDKVVEMLSGNLAVGVIGGYYEEGFPIHFVSAFTLNNLGYTMESLMEATGGLFLNLVCPDDRSFFVMGMKERPEAAREYRLLHQNGEVVWVNELRTESVAEDGRKLWIGSIRLVQNEHMARREFISKISHDVRTPLNAIIGVAKLIAMQKNDSEKLREYLEVIVNSSYHLLHQMDEVLEMNSIESGVINLEEQGFSMHEFIEELREIFVPRLEEREQELEIIYEDIAHDKVLGDVLNIQKIFINLLENASKYSPHDSQIQLVVHENPQTQVEYAEYEIKVIDHGVGIDESMLERIFQPFERIEDSRVTGGIPHIGLGLAITKSIVEMMNGKLSVTSKLQGGSCFMVSLPLKIQLDDVAQGQLENKSVLDGMRILAVEDNEINQEILVELLRAENVTVEIAENGLRAVEIFREKKKSYYDAILMDIHMPLMDGYEATENIRMIAENGGDTIPIIAVTADTMQEDIEMALQYGMNGHISKPLNFEELKATLSFWHNRHSLKGMH